MNKNDIRLLTCNNLYLFILIGSQIGLPPYWNFSWTPPIPRIRLGFWHWHFQIFWILRASMWPVFRSIYFYLAVDSWTACEVLKMSSHPYWHFPARCRGNWSSFCQTSKFYRSFRFTQVWLRPEPGKVFMGTCSKYWWMYCEIDFRRSVFSNDVLAVTLKRSPVSQAIMPLSAAIPGNSKGFVDFCRQFLGRNGGIGLPLHFRD